MWRKFAGIRLTAVCAVIRWKSTGKPPCFLPLCFVFFSGLPTTLIQRSTLPDGLSSSRVTHE